MLIPAARPVFTEADLQAITSRVRRIIEGGRFTLGEYTAEFEHEFAQATGVAHAVAVSSGTSALEIVLRVLGVSGAQVVVPTNTFFATAAAVVHAGGVPCFADVGAHDMMLTLETLRAAVTDRTAGVIVVHIGGMISREIDDIARYCDERGLFLLEDAAHACGSSHRGRAAGSIGAAGAFSLYPTKIIASGEGGMITTDSASIAEEALIYRDQGKASFDQNHHVRMGYNWRMSEFHAAVGAVHLRHLQQFVATKQRIARFYDTALRQLPQVSALPEPEGTRSNHHKYIALLAPGVDRDEVKKALRDECSVSLSGEVFETPLHRQPVFQGLAHGRFPVAEELSSRHICLPIHSDMTIDEAAYVIDCLAAVLHRRQ